MLNQSYLKTKIRTRRNIPSSINTDQLTISENLSTVMNNSWMTESLHKLDRVKFKLNLLKLVSPNLKKKTNTRQREHRDDRRKEGFKSFTWTHH